MTPDWWTWFKWHIDAVIEAAAAALAVKPDYARQTEQGHDIPWRHSERPEQQAGSYG